MLLLLPLNSWTPLFSESVRFALVPRQIVEKRLAKYAGNNEQREATLGKGSPMPAATINIFLNNR